MKTPSWHLLSMIEYVVFIRTCMEWHGSTTGATHTSGCHDDHSLIVEMCLQCKHCCAAPAERPV